MFYSICFLMVIQTMAAQDHDVMYAFMRLTGADSPEEMDENEAERLSALLERPLRINVSSFSRMVSSGLFSPYQAASLSDYIARHGPVLSFAELAAVDGFGAESVEVLRPFVSLKNGGVGPEGSRGIWNDIIIRTGIRSSQGERKWNYGIKYSVESFRGISAGLAVSKSDDSGGAPDMFSANIEWEADKIPLRIIAGDFNARFGQGLALWNGMSMSSLNSPSSFIRRPSGYSRSSSFTGNYAMTGLAVSSRLRCLTVNASVSFPGIRTSYDAVSVMPALNVVWNHRNGQIGMTHYMDFSRSGSENNDVKSSIDIAWCIRGIDLFGEVAYDWKSGSPAALAGSVFPIGESWRSGVMIRIYPPEYSSLRSGAQRSSTKCSDEMSATFAAEYTGADRMNSFMFSADGAYFPVPKDKSCPNNSQFKLQASWERNGEYVFIRLRLKERIRDWGPASHADLRSDVAVNLGKANLDFRLNLLYCRSLSGLGYIEGGYKTSKLSAYLKAGVFFVDNWDDRIYAYERDAPGSFNVPVFYGRGVWAAAVSSWKFSRWGKMYLRASCTGYPFMSGEKKKPGKAELRLQFMFSF